MMIMMMMDEDYIIKRVRAFQSFEDDRFQRLLRKDGKMVKEGWNQGGRDHSYIKVPVSP